MPDRCLVSADHTRPSSPSYGSIHGDQVVWNPSEGQNDDPFDFDSARDGIDPPFLHLA